MEIDFPSSEHRRAEVSMREWRLCAQGQEARGFYRAEKGTFGVEDSTCRAVPLQS